MDYNNNIKFKSIQLFIAISVAILTTGFLRLQIFAGLPETDGGIYTFLNQYIYFTLEDGGNLKDTTFLLYQFMTAWVYGLEVNQFILLRLIDGLVAIVASIILFKVILKESGSTLFTVILVTTLLISMNNFEVVLYGYRNSIWAAYLPLFTALLVWQNANKQDKYSFYSIGGLVALGVLLREAFLPFFLLAGISILIAYGWRVLIKYLIGSAVVGFTLLGVTLMFRGWDLVNLLNSYFSVFGTYIFFKNSFLLSFLATIKKNWFIYTAGAMSVIYLIKLYSTNKKLVSINRVYIWLAIFLLPMIEPIMKIGFEYHFANCLVGFAGLSAMTWKHVMAQESKKVMTSSIIIIGLMSLLVILPTINRTIIKSNYIFSPYDAIKWVKATDWFRGEQMIESSQYLKVAAKLYGLSREDSTLVVSGIMQVLYPLTELLPPAYKLHDLGQLFIKLNYDDEELIKIIQKYRPTLIMTSGLSYGAEKNLPGIIENTNLYEQVDTVKGNLKIQYGWKFKSAGIIYRLKDFK